MAKPDDEESEYLLRQQAASPLPDTSLASLGEGEARALLLAGLSSPTATVSSAGSDPDAFKPTPSHPDFGSLEAAHRRIFDSGLTFSEAKGQIWELRKSGLLTKRGFRFRKLWVRRYVELSGRMLKYYESKPRDEAAAANPRGRLELTQHTAVVALPNTSSQRFAFNVIPEGNNPKGPGAGSGGAGSGGAGERRGSTGSSGGGGWFSWLTGGGGGGEPHEESDKVWRFMARSERERADWIHILERAISLIRRVEVAPTLCGVGSVHYHYRLGEKIGRGRFGDVYAAVAAMTEQEYAIKAVDKEKRVKTKEDALVLRSEIKVMRRITRELDHTNICKLFQAYEDTSMVYLVLEKLSGGDLYEHLAAQRSALTEVQVADVVRQVAGALRELHGAGIVLCDLRPENLLYTSPESNIVKVVEFGRAIIVQPQQSATASNAPGNGNGDNNAAQGRPQQQQQQQQQQLQEAAQDNQRQAANGGAATYAPPKTSSVELLSGGGKRASMLNGGSSAPLVGTPGFIAPEVVAARDYSPACDVWALGCIAFALLAGHPPFQERTTAEVFQATALGLQADKLKQEDWKDVSRAARLIVGGMLRTRPDRRLDAPAVLADPWLREPGQGQLPIAHARIKALAAQRGPSLAAKAAAVMSPQRHRPASGSNSQISPVGAQSRSATVTGDRRSQPRAAPAIEAPGSAGRSGGPGGSNGGRRPLSSTGRRAADGLSTGPKLASNWSTPDFLAEQKKHLTSGKESDAPPPLQLPLAGALGAAQTQAHAHAHAHAHAAQQASDAVAAEADEAEASLRSNLSHSTFLELLQQQYNPDAERAVTARAELLALDVRAEKIRAQFNDDEWGLPRSPLASDDTQANFAPAGRFLNDLEGQMRKVREEEQRLDATAHQAMPPAQRQPKHAVTEQQASGFQQHQHHHSTPLERGQANSQQHPPAQPKPQAPPQTARAAQVPAQAARVAQAQEQRAPHSKPALPAAQQTRQAKHLQANATRDKHESEAEENNAAGQEEEEEEEEEDVDDEDASVTFASQVSRTLATSGAVIARAAAASVEELEGLRS